MYHNRRTIVKAPEQQAEEPQKASNVLPFKAPSNRKKGKKKKSKR